MRPKPSSSRTTPCPSGVIIRKYLLRGLATCTGCGMTYVGVTHTKAKKAYRYYRCGGQCTSIRIEPAKRCRSKLVPADWLEETVWDDCRAFAHNPGAALDEAARQLRGRLGRAAESEPERAHLQRELAGKEAERERVMTLYRRGRATLGDTERQLDDINDEAARLRTALDAIRAQRDLAQAFEARYASAAAMLGRIREQVDEADRTNDWDLKRAVVEQLVIAIRIGTEGTGRRKQPTYAIRYAFEDPSAVDSTRPTSTARSKASAA
jgi:site-specific DNA recombinase